jgi:DNA-binding transcriptional MerR regulator
LITDPVTNEGRSTAGYRLFRDRDLIRPEQVVILKFLGLP